MPGKRPQTPLSLSRSPMTPETRPSARAPSSQTSRHLKPKPTINREPEINYLLWVIQFSVGIRRRRCGHRIIAGLPSCASPVRSLTAFSTRVMPEMNPHVWGYWRFKHLPILQALVGVTELAGRVASITLEPRTDRVDRVAHCADSRLDQSGHRESPPRSLRARTL